jgi:hypothetical protein
MLTWLVISTRDRLELSPCARRKIGRMLIGSTISADVGDFELIVLDVRINLVIGSDLCPVVWQENSGFL